LIFRNRFFIDPLFVGVPIVDYRYPYSMNQDYVAPAAAESSDRERQLADSVDRLTGEVRSLREDEEVREEAAQAQSAPRAAAPQTAPSGMPETLLVFRDGHRITVRNYAIVGSTLWKLSEGAARKFSLADIDVEATRKANSANGVEFPLR
jgi:hypothetical protein